MSLIGTLDKMYKNNLSLIYTEKYKNETEFVPMNFVDFYVGSKEEKKVTELKGILSDETSLKSEIGKDLNLIENYIDSKKFRIFVLNSVPIRLII